MKFYWDTKCDLPKSVNNHRLGKAQSPYTLISRTAMNKHGLAINTWKNMIYLPTKHIQDAKM